MSWNDFNSAEDQQTFDLIPRGTIAKVRMTIKRGGYNDSNHGWTDGYATENAETGSVYLSCEFVILEGLFAKRKFWSLIGLHSEKGPEWGNMGRTLIKAILNSAFRLNPDDQSLAAQQARRIEGIHVLNGIEFVAQVGIEKDSHDELRNTLKFAVTPDHKDYAAIMNGGAATTSQTLNASLPSQKPTDSTQPKVPTGRPAWAQ